MEELNFEKDYAEYLNRWGLDAQIRMTVEEMSELTKELMKYMRAVNSEDSDDKQDRINKVVKDLQSEIADVINCAEQMRLIFGKDEVDEIRKQKIQRTNNKIKEAESKK